MLVSGYKIKKAKKPFLACCDYGWPAHFSDVLSLRTFQVQPVVVLRVGAWWRKNLARRHSKGEGSLNNSSISVELISSSWGLLTIQKPQELVGKYWLFHGPVRRFLQTQAGLLCGPFSLADQLDVWRSTVSGAWCEFIQIHGCFCAESC